jgi:hypothetical protein
MPQSFTDIVNRQMHVWDRNVHSQYAMAYNTAYVSFQKSASAAEAAEKADADFFATMVSIMSCSVGIAVLGESWLTRLVVRSGLRTLGASNTRAVANLVRQGQKHAVIGFVFGKATDVVKDAASDKFKKIAASLVQQVVGGLTQTNPLNRYIELQNLLSVQSDHLTDMALAIESDRGMSVTQKATGTAALHNSPVLSPPGNKLNSDKLALKIELAFLLNTVLVGDHLRTHYSPEMRIPSQRGRDIAVMPSDTAYPKSQRPVTGGVWNTVEVDRPSMVFQDRIDELHNLIFKSDFYEAAWLARKILPNNEFGRLSEVKKAEKQLNELSSLTRPKNAMFSAF